MPVMIFSQLAGLVTLLLVLPILPTATASHADLLWGAVAGMALGMGVTLLYQALATGKMNVVAPITAVLAVLVAAMVGIMTGDRLSVGAFVGVALAIVAITLISQGLAPEQLGQRSNAGDNFSAALSAGVFIGVFFVGIKQTNPTSGLLPLVSARLAAVFALVATALLRRTSLRVGRGVVWMVVACGMLDIFANVLYLLATRQGILTVAATLSSLYPASTIVLAHLILGERLSCIQIAGLLCAALGIILITVG
jgi:uncharacterized membrane protein